MSYFTTEVRMKAMKTARILSMIVIASLVVGAVALAFPAIVKAQGTNPPAQPAGQSQQTKQVDRLEKAYQRELKALDAQAKRLAAADDRVQKFSERIANLKSQGKDVSALEKALNDFKDVLKAARASHDSAAAILRTRAGFDANGKVTDAQQAKDTVQEAAKLLRQARQDLRPAVRDLAQAVRQYIKDNRSK
jgi:hypothetical protein